MADSFNSLYTEFILGCLQIQLGVISSVGVWTLSAAKLQAAQPHQNWKSLSEINPQSAEQYSETPVGITRQYPLGTATPNAQVGEPSHETGFAAPWLLKTHSLELSMPRLYQLEPTPILTKFRGLIPLPLQAESFGSGSKSPDALYETLRVACFSAGVRRLANAALTQNLITNYELRITNYLMAAPENFNPDLRLPPVLPKPPQNSSPVTTSTEPGTPDAVLESINTDYRYDTDNFGQTNFFFEPTMQFGLSNGNKIFFKTGFNFFEQRGVESVTNFPLQVGWQGKIGQVTLQTSAGVDVFNRLPTAINLNAKVEVPISAPQVSPSGRLLSVAVLSGNLEHGPYKSNARTLENQITAWRFGPDLYWQIDRDTSLFSSLRLGSYNDGNSEVQSFSRLERKFGQFSLAANLFTWSYERDLERRSGYFSPPDFLVYNGELAWEGDIANFLRCRLAANLGQQRLKGQFGNANTYQTRCTVKLSPNIEADLGYSFSNIRSQDTGESAYSGNSLTGQLRVKF